MHTDGWDIDTEDPAHQVKKSKTSIVSWKKKFMSDFRNKDFIPIKVLFFLVYGANVALIPFLTLQARSIGITEEEVGIIYSFIPIASLIAPALSGILADRIGNFKILLSLSTALSGLCGLLFLLVPVGRITYKLPDDLPYEFTLFQDGSALYLTEPYQCEVIHTLESFHLNIHQCSLKCANKTMGKDLTRRVNIKPNLSCKNASCLQGDHYEAVNLFETTNLDKFYEVIAIEPQDINVTLRISHEMEESKPSITYSSLQPISLNMEKHQDLLNSGVECYVSCDAKSPREKHCSNQVSLKEINSQLTFYFHLAIRLLTEFTLATSMPLLDGAAVSILREHKGDFGFQRMYCNLGMMVITPISGTLIDYFSLVNHLEDYRPAMYMYCLLKLVAAVIILFLSLNFKKGSKKIISEFSNMFLNGEIVAFLIAVFLAGIFYGYLETFLFWLLEDLGADKQMMGMTVTVGSFFGIPVLMVSTFIIKKFGYKNTIYAGFAVYILRLIGYSFITSPWWAMPFEALECVTVSLMVVTFVSYASFLASPTTVVTLQGMQGGLYNGVGRGAGSLIGGYLIESLGLSQTYQVMAAVSAAAGILYFSLTFLIELHRRGTTKNEAQINENGTTENGQNSEVISECQTHTNSAFVGDDGK